MSFQSFCSEELVWMFRVPRARSLSVLRESWRSYGYTILNFVVCECDHRRERSKYHWVNKLNKFKSENFFFVGPNKRIDANFLWTERRSDCTNRLYRGSERVRSIWARRWLSWYFVRHRLRSETICNQIAARRSLCSFRAATQSARRIFTLISLFLFFFWLLF